MGGQRYSERVFDWAVSTDLPLTLDRAMSDLDLTSKQARQALRRFVNEGKLEQVSSQEWRVVGHQVSSNGDVHRTGDLITTGARRARAATRAVAPITFEQIDVFTDGASLLRSDDGEFYRGYITKLD